MKKRFCMLALCLILSVLSVLTGCQQHLSDMELQKPFPIPSDGLIGKERLIELKNRHAIGVFTGESAGCTYEWTVFGHDLPDTDALHDTDFSVRLSLLSDQQGVSFSLREAYALNFPAMLSIHLNGQWTAQTAIVYRVGINQALTPVSSASVTGSDHTILNIAVRDLSGTFLILPEEKETDAPETESGNESDSTPETQDRFHTDPTPPGKPSPVEPEDQEVDTEKELSCTFSIDCVSILNHIADLDPSKREMLPSDGMILKTVRVTFHQGESVFDVLQRVCRENRIHLESSFTPMYNSAYVEGIHNLYEFDCGNLSGWMYSVNGWFPNYGVSRYALKDGDVVAFRYTCDLGKDIGCSWMGGQS